ncbi:MAG: radical SAM protein [Nitrososphaeria archaeon]|nr:radical SAM protein [Nitrososphaeria archaeon]
MELPRGIQVEVTNRCNFKCVYCLRNFWNIKIQDMPLALFKKLSNSFSEMETVVLYGLGEPLTHPDFVEMVRLARSSIKKDGVISFSTNGSLLDVKLAEKLIKDIGVNLISFSFDTIETLALERLRVGAESHMILENLKEVSRLKKFSKFPFTLSIEVVLMKDTLEYLPKLVEFAAQNDVDRILVTNVIPYTEVLNGQQLFLTVSETSYNIVKDFLDEGWNIIHDAIMESHGLIYAGKSAYSALEKYRMFWKKAEEYDCWINFPMLIQMKSVLENVKRALHVFKESTKLASAYDIELQLPNQFADRKKRICPYVDKDFSVIRADGSVVPCMEFMYAYYEYVNLHKRLVKEVVFGNIKKEDLKRVWSADDFKNFRMSRKDLNKNFPWCGECVYSTLNCYYTSSSEKDCMGNKDSCSECLYSVNIAQCLL